jgi:NTE family protein
VQLKRVALVLAGGAARGAYEVGVVQYVVETVAAAIKRDIRFQYLCGTSVGALNACGLAAWAHEGNGAVSRLRDVWQKLDLHELVRTDVRGIFSALSPFRDRAMRRTGEVPLREGGVLDPRGIEDVVHQSIPFERIDDNLASGLVDAITVSTTHVQSGRTVVFVQTPSGKLPPWSHDPTVEPRWAKIRAHHALASAAIPILFRSVKIGNEFHCDGGLRQNIPLSPARRLGADALLVVNPRYVPTTPLYEGTSAREESLPGPLFLLGKTLNALLLDRIDTDLARLESVNKILGAGARVCGAGFIDALNNTLGYAPGKGLRPMNAMLVRSSQDIGVLAAEFVRHNTNSMTGFTGRLMRRLAGTTDIPQNESELLSYMLFDGRFAKILIDLGYADAKARHDELCDFFEKLAS